MVVWMVAIATAITSIFVYWRCRKHWFIVVCLTLNLVGLAFSVFVLLGVFRIYI